MFSSMHSQKSCVVVCPEKDGLAVSELEELYRHCAANEASDAPRPDAVRLLRRHQGVKARIRGDLPPGHDVPDLREEFVPALVCKNFTGWSSLDWSAARQRIPELLVCGVSGEVGVIGQTLRRRFG